LTRGAVNFYFLAPAAGEPLTRSPALAKLLQDLAPDVFHVHGLNFAREVSGLRGLAPGKPILLQDHADRPPRFWRRGRFRRGMGHADGVSFCAREQAEAFERAGVLGSDTKVFEIPESTSRFTPGPRDAVRASMGISGNPALLWVGHLDTNKDPMTVLAGVSRASRELPGMTLTCCYGSAPLLASVQEQIAGDPQLRDRVRLLGRLSHDGIQDLMRAADLLVLGSHREGCNFSVLEALASGLLPVVTDIPSMRVLTGQGQAGELWQRGDAESLKAALLRAARRDDVERRRTARAHFESQLSAAALGGKFARAYEELQRLRHCRSLAGRAP
jgi:glycosyltransferase involved in cell wall biosynthesis